MAKADLTMPSATSGSGEHGHTAGKLWPLALGSLGVVYGDIGTSPLYAFKEAILAATDKGQLFSQDIVLGVLSLILWALIIVVTLKYVLILLRADNNGEGGTLSLTSLAFRALGRRAPMIALLGIIGASMFLGDSMITPAISVLSAVEGLKLYTRAFDPYVVPLTIVVLIMLFAVQRRGTANVAAFFGPVMLVWFAVLAVSGAMHIADAPSVLFAINPHYAVDFIYQHPGLGLLTLGAVVLVVTGGEALYSDLGHFGRKPIQVTWLTFVLPALLLNYFGQGALVLSHPEIVVPDFNPFFQLFPGWALLPMVLLATLATVIASQAVITGAYSLVRQAIQLGLLPRLAILHTSETLSGQIYIPRVNTALLIGVLFLVLVFKSSDALAGAYGIAVVTSMTVDAILGFVVVWRLWGWKLWAAVLIMAPFLLVDGTLLVATLHKLQEGGWITVLFGATMVLLILTWQRGTRLLGQKTRKVEVELQSLLQSLEKRPPHVVPGTAVFLTSDPEFAPTALLHNLKHNKVLHEHNVVLTIITADTPRVPDAERVQMTQITPRFSRVSLRFGYMETPNVPKGLAIARKLGWQFDIMSTSFFLSRRALKPAAASGMPRWQDRLFIALARSASDATDFFQIPTGRVVEVGTQVTV